MIFLAKPLFGLCPRCTLERPIRAINFCGWLCIEEKRSLYRPREAIWVGGAGRFRAGLREDAGLGGA